MNTATTNKLMIELLASYQQLVIKQLTEQDLVSEFLTAEKLGNARLLCQMRTIIFLCKTAHWLDSTNIALAEKLYINAESAYLIEDKWLQQLHNDAEATLYSYAFVILAQSYLLKMTHNQLYAIAIAETFTLVTSKFQGATIFKPLSNLACLEQNSAMHLYEALTFACYQAEAVYMRPTIQALEQLIKDTFGQEHNLLAEKVSYAGQVLSYETGHWFEWVTLLLRVNKWGKQTTIDPMLFYQQAIDKTPFTEQGLVLNEMNHRLMPLDTKQIRIWPNLEFLRANTLVTGNLPSQELITFMQLFFDDKGWPIEYLGAPNAGVKSTTGYHIAECFVDILEVKR